MVTLTTYFFEMKSQYVIQAGLELPIWYSPDYPWTHDLPALASQVAGLQEHITTPAIFNFLRTCRTVFQSGWTILYSYLQNTRFAISLHSCQHLLYVCLIIAILVSAKGAITVLLICISLIMPTFWRLVGIDLAFWAREKDQKGQKLYV